MLVEVGLPCGEAPREGGMLARGKCRKHRLHGPCVVAGVAIINSQQWLSVITAADDGGDGEFAGAVSAEEIQQPS